MERGVSSPTWGRGLKQLKEREEKINALVVPYMGTWIETDFVNTLVTFVSVVPYMGTWIETPEKAQEVIDSRGVPYMGTWIETRNGLPLSSLRMGRPLHGDVD